MMNQSDMLHYVFHATLIGVIAWVWIKIILDVDNLGFIYDLFFKILDGDISKHIFKPLFACFYCFAGQASLWGYFALYGFESYQIHYHIGFICLSVLTTQIINKKYG